MKFLIHITVLRNSFIANQIEEEFQEPEKVKKKHTFFK